MKKQKIFLIPTDFSSQTYIALEQSYNLARFHDAKIVLLSADNKAGAKAMLEEMAEKARKESGLKVETIVRKGNIYRVTEDVAEELKDVEMIVLGLESKITLNKIMGPSAFRLERESGFPVLTIRGKTHRKGCGNILLPLDLSKQTRQKVDKAVELARFYGAVIHVCNVLARRNTIKENKLKAYGHQVKEHIRKAGVKVSVKTLYGKDTAGLIIEYALEKEADLILIMSKAELNVQEFFIGTVAQRIINDSPIPVLSIRPQKTSEIVSFNPY